MEMVLFMQYNSERDLMTVEQLLFFLVTWQKYIGGAIYLKADIFGDVKI